MRKITILIVTGIIIRYMLVTLLAYNVRIGCSVFLYVSVSTKSLQLLSMSCIRCLFFRTNLGALFIIVNPLKFIIGNFSAAFGRENPGNKSKLPDLSSISASFLAKSAFSSLMIVHLSRLGMGSNESIHDSSTGTYFFFSLIS